ncbi:MAG: hypothetical protein OQK57_04815, partial [Ignavibacteriaceae bacterium]|nr:hypothetical protein [Ignavibacteriaceae bacterium]
MNRYNNKYFAMKMDSISRLTVVLLFIGPISLLGQESDRLTHSVYEDKVPHSYLESETSSTIGSLEEYVRLNQELPSEKIFLHLDRPDYMQGDTIWFKAYLWYGFDQLPDTLSGVLYVDLISSQGHIMLTRKLLIQNGTAHGQFSLDSTITSGSYSLCAYTRLMQNPDMGDPFCQTVIINPSRQNFHFECIPVIRKQPGNDSLQMRLKFFEIDPDGNLNSTYKHDISYTLKIGDQILLEGAISLENTKKYILTCGLTGLSTLDSLADLEIFIQDDILFFEYQFHIPLQEYIDLQFFPEGGNLVCGLESKVAFKAIGPDGLGREVIGEIKTGDDTLVTGFSSAHKGMGTFMLKPEPNKKYFAHLWFNKRKYIVPLPPAAEKGVAMSVLFSAENDNPFVLIKQKPGGVIEPKYVIGSAYGKIWFAAIVKTFRDSSRLQVPLDLLPEGICRLTVLNAEFNPECERLIYVDKNQRLFIEVTPDSSSYNPRSRVALQIDVSDASGIPVETELSISVVDKEQINEAGVSQGISEYKLLESELKGYIEDIDSYFENGHCTNNGALDLLMLTQGYRKFVPAEQSMEELKFRPEKGFDITGRIEFEGSKLREKKFNYQEVNLTLLSYSEDFYIET